MSNKQYAYINNNMLRWARKETPLEISDVSIRIKDISESEIEKWESGVEFPSINDAKKLANLYDVPFSAFYLTELPPSAKEKYIDRRTFSISNYSGISYELWKELRYFKSCRENILSIIDNDYEGANIPKFRKGDNIDKITMDIREYLKLDTPLKCKSSFGNNVFSYFRKKIEKKGILVFQISGIELTQVRGISLNYDLFPIIAVNKNDSDRAKVFTIFHELAHLIRRTSALCSIDFSKDRDDEEKICDEIAGNILIPKYKLENMDLDNIDNNKINELANLFGVSKFVVLKRLYDDKKISYFFYKDKYEEFYNNFMSNKERIAREKSNTVVPYHVKFISKNGNLFPSTVINAYYEGRASLGEVCRILNVKTKQIEKVERLVMF